MNNPYNNANGVEMINKLIHYYDHISNHDSYLNDEYNSEIINRLKQKRQSRIEQEQKRQEALMKQNEINMHATAWGTSLPALLAAFGLPGLLAGGTVYGGLKLYDRYNRNKMLKSDYFDYGNYQENWLDEPYRLVQQDSVGTILEQQMNSAIEAGVHNEPNDYSTIDHRPIPMMHPTDIETRRKIKKLIKY